MKRLIFLGLVLTVALSACAPILTAASAGEPSPAATATPAPPSPTPTLIPTPTLTPTPTIPPSPTPTPHPMSIAGQRAASYPGSEIVIERELTAAYNHRRYYAYYLSEGYKIYGLLTVPSDEMPPGGWPAIVFNHGYIPPDVYRTTERYVAYVNRLAQSGYIVFRIDYRGHDQSEGEANGAYGNPGYLTDVLNAVAALQRFPDANPDKIGMWGHSMGGYLTLRAMVVSDQVKAGVIWAGVVASYPDMLYNWRHNDFARIPTPSSGARRWRDLWLETYGTPDENPQFWASVSANSYLADLSGPVQLHHGTADTDVPVAFSEGLYQQALAAGQNVELYTYEGDDHNLAGYFSLAMNRTIEFYDRYLK